MAVAAVVAQHVRGPPQVTQKGGRGSRGNAPPHRSAGPPTEPRRRVGGSVPRKELHRLNHKMAAPGPVCQHRPGPGASPETGQENARAHMLHRRGAAALGGHGELRMSGRRPGRAVGGAGASLALSRRHAPAARRGDRRLRRAGAFEVWRTTPDHAAGVANRVGRLPLPSPTPGLRVALRVAGGLRTPATQATHRSGRGQGRAMTPEFVNRPFISRSGWRRFGALASDLS